MNHRSAFFRNIYRVGIISLYLDIFALYVLVEESDMKTAEVPVPR